MISDMTFCVSKKCKWRDKCQRTLHPKVGFHSYADFEEQCKKEDRIHFILIPKKKKDWTGEVIIDIIADIIDEII